jgi:hypothetical protein
MDGQWLAAVGIIWPVSSLMWSEFNENVTKLRT